MTPKTNYLCAEFNWIRSVYLLVLSGIVTLSACSQSNTNRQAEFKTEDRQSEIADNQTELATSSSANLKILNWNVLYGFNHGKAVDQGVDWIAERKPDVVALQELNSITGDELSEIAARWGHQHSVILKEKGFPVGLTSNAPIDVLERRVDGFHHGFLHCKTSGIHFFVVHFWPGKDHEAELVLESISKLHSKGESVIVLGDFNTHSRADREYLESRSGVTPRYQVIDLFESQGFVDLVLKHSPDEKYSCPSPITIPRWSADLEKLETKKQRIDFVLADSNLAKGSSSAKILRSTMLDAISDHYPVFVTIRPVSE